MDNVQLPHIPQPKKKSFLKSLFFLEIGLFEVGFVVVLLGLVFGVLSYFHVLDIRKTFLGHMFSSYPLSYTSFSPTPSVAPLIFTTVDSAFQQNNDNIQQSLNQADIDAYAAQKTSQQESVDPQAQSDQLSQIIAAGNAMISTRLKSLHVLLTRVNGDKKLSNMDKTSLTRDNTTMITSLTSLKNQIDKETSVDSAQTAVKSIVTSYRIYEMYQPKQLLFLITRDLINTSSSIRSFVAKTQTLFSVLKLQGQDMNNAQAALDGISTQLASSNTLLATDQSLVNTVNLTTPNPQLIFDKIQKDVASIHVSYKKIQNNFAQIRAIVQINLLKKK